MSKVIITVVGKDTVGIIAKVCAYLAEKHVNVLDISQTIVQEYFCLLYTSCICWIGRDKRRSDWINTIRSSRVYIETIEKRIWICSIISVSYTHLIDRLRNEIGRAVSLAVGKSAKRIIIRRNCTTAKAICGVSADIMKT